MWGDILGQEISPQQIALCLSQMYLSELIDNPSQPDKAFDAASAIFAFEALNQIEDKIHE